MDSSGGLGDPIEGRPYYYAAGAGGQRIFVFPDEEMVVVHLTNTYQRRNVPHESIHQILSLLLADKLDQPKSNPKTKTLETISLPSAVSTFTDWQLAQWPGNYQIPNIGSIKVFNVADRLFDEM